MKGTMHDETGSRILKTMERGEKGPHERGAVFGGKREGRREHAMDSKEARHNVPMGHKASRGGFDHVSKTSSRREDGHY